MTNLNLVANTPEEKIIKEHLLPMLDERLATKIANGVYIEKDGKKLLNKKTLTTFMSYLCGEALKLVKDSAGYKTKDGKTVKVNGMDGQKILGLAIHYFEEDDIEGTLYNEDGTEYKPVVEKPVTPTTVKTVTSVINKPAPKPQMSIFDDLLGGQNEQSEPIVKQNKKEIAPNISAIKPKQEGSKLYQEYMNIQNEHPDCIVFARLGDFYEALGDSAIKASKELDLTLTGRDCGLAERVAMCGIPYHAADNYIKKLAEKGYKIVVAEELKDSSTHRVISTNTVKENGQTIDIETGEIIKELDDDELPIEELSVEEMEKFDYVGDEDDSEELVTVSKLTAGLNVGNDDDDETLEFERQIAQAFDKEAMCIFSDLFDGKINLA